MVNFSVIPTRMALINVDMQNCFVEEAPDGLLVLDRINHLAAACKATLWSMRIITQVLSANEMVEKIRYAVSATQSAQRAV